MTPPPASGARGPRFRNGWILCPGGDLAMFAGPLVAAAAIVAAFAARGRLHEDVPPWLFVLLVVGVDVSHVWATLFRTYLDPQERARRAGRLTAVPVACFLGGVLLWTADGQGLLFWRVLAYVAAFHFVRQQIGWMAYAGRRAGERSRLDLRLDRLAIYAATVFPLLWWHAHLPRSFRWFVEGDFAGGLPSTIAEVAHVLHFVVLAAWCARQAWLAATRRGANLAKVLVLATTWATWYGGIVLLDSDVAFTASNVLAHGVPYLVVVRRWGRGRWAGTGSLREELFRPAGWAPFAALLFGIAFLEEGIWDRFVWHDHASLFPAPGVALPSWLLAVVVPLLAVPQATHYVLDAWLWRTGAENPDLAARLGWETPPSAAGAVP